MNHSIAVDLGGTHIRVAAYEPNNIKPISRKRAKTHASESGVFHSYYLDNLVIAKTALGDDAGLLGTL